ncbi:MAG: PKD-like domain-containing protein [Bacteroidia bacterium]|nr:PKD-like domain-containing protein [Bacteroidia bacterium]
MKNKIYLIISFAILFFFHGHSQNVTVEIDGDNLSYTEPGCDDCNGNPDPSWRVRATTPSGTYNWNVDIDELCGWSGATNFTWVAPQTQLATAPISISMDGWERDSWFCGSDDNVCGGYSTLGTVIINTNPPCQWNYNTYQRNCGGDPGTYAVRWSYYWFYQTILPGSIAVDDTICAGEDPDSLSSITAGTVYATYQWQYSDDNGTTWIDILGATGLNYDPPAGLANTRWFRRKASSCGGVADVFSNIVVITVNPTPVATATPATQILCSGDSSSIVLTSTLIGTTFSWTVVETAPLGAFANTDSTITQLLTTTGVVSDTATYTITPATLLCTGAPITAIVVVNPIPLAFATPTSQTICSGDTTSIALTSNVAGATFSWTVFLAGVSGGTLGSDSSMLEQTLINTGTTPGTAVYAVSAVGSGCPGAPVNVAITVNPLDNASFTYTSATYCQSGSNQTPTITGLPGGVFTSTPSGLSINPLTGTIDLSTSALGAYNLCYSTNGVCPLTSCIVMTITNATPSAIFSYIGSPFCQNGINPFPVYDVGASAGIFSATPAGLVFAHVNTGEIDLSACAPGTYTITNTIPPSGFCLGVSASTVVTIVPSDDASFTYPSATYCTSGPAQTPTITGLPGGTFSAVPAGLTINPVTGTIDLSTSALGAYTLSYTTNGACPNISSITMTIINNNPSAGYSYIGSPFCQNGSNPNPLFVTGASAGIFSSTPVGLVFVHVNTGQIDLAASAPGTYTVTNNIPPSGSCGPVSAATTIIITPGDDASFLYSSATYCTSGTNQTPVITGLPGGTFSSTPIGLSLNATTGMITLSTSALGVYTLFYTTNGSCPNTSSITMTITNSTPFAMFSYAGSSHCQNGSNPLPVFPPGASAGIFSATPAGLAFVNLNTGEVDLAACTPGTYTVTNNIPASGFCTATSATTTIIINPSDDAAFTYTSATYCQSGTIQVPTITGLPGGAFSSVPSGLSINPVTGAINLSLSALGVYTLSYSTNGGCPNTSSITMTIINANPAANFSYTASPFCQNINNPFPSFGSGASAGTFSATPVGIVFAHVNTGEIDLASSAPGTYTVTNTIPASGSCGPVSATSTVVINSADDASFVYSSATYCTSGTNQTPAITGLPGGVFSAIPPGLSINPSTGEINLSSSNTGAYTLSYTTNGSCPNTSSITMTIINSGPDAVFTYSSVSYCQNGIDPLPVFGSGASAGTFSALPAGLVFIHVNTGEIDLASSLPGTYIVTNDIPVSGTCGLVTATTTVIITPSDDASFTYPSATYCTSGVDPTPAITGLPGGTFSSVPVGLSINSTTGAIDLSSSALGAYTLSYSTFGTCPNTSSIIMTIADSITSANFSYSGSPFCQNINNPFPTFAVGASAGIFSASPAGLVFEHVNTGEIDLASSAPGTYTITNTIPQSGFCIGVSATATVVINPSPVVTATPAFQNICIGGTTSILLTSSMPGTNFAWTVIQTGTSGGTPGMGSSISQTLNITGTIQGIATYTITSDAGGCTGAPVIVPVTVNLLPVSDTSAVVVTLSNCGGPTGGVSGVTMASGQTPFQFEWKDAGGAVVGTSADLSNVVPGVYTLSVTDANGCVITVGSFTVNPTPPITAQFTANPLTGETPLTVNFTNTSIGAANYLWEFGTGDTSNLVNPAYVYVPLGVSTVCLTAISATGCIDTACALIDVYLNSVFIIPNIFSPNDDNLNDVFTVQGIGLIKMDAEIYNRWGHKQFEWHAVNGGWDGRTASGLQAASGTYYYIIKASGIDGKEYSEKGFFDLVR